MVNEYFVIDVWLGPKGNSKILLQKSGRKDVTQTVFLIRYTHLSTQFDMKKREVELIEERMKQSTHHVKVEELQAHEKEIGNLAIC